MKKTLCLLAALGTLVSSTAFAQPKPQPQAQTPQPAPAPNEPKPSWMQYKDPYVNQEDITTPHRSNTEIQQWSQEIMTDILNLTPPNYQAQLRRLKSFFEKESWVTYVKFLKETGYLETVTKQGLSIEAIVRKPPEIVTNKAVEGAYHWVLKMPMTITTFVMAGDNKQTQSSTNYTVFVDLQRAEHAKNTMEITINDLRFDKDIIGQP